MTRQNRLSFVRARVHSKKVDSPALIRPLSLSTLGPLPPLTVERTQGGRTSCGSIWLRADNSSFPGLPLRDSTHEVDGPWSIRLRVSAGVRPSDERGTQPEPSTSATKITEFLQSSRV